MTVLVDSCSLSDAPEDSYILFLCHFGLKLKSSRDDCVPLTACCVRVSYPGLISASDQGVRDMFSKRAGKQREFHKRPLSAANTYAVVTVSRARILSLMPRIMP